MFELSEEVLEGGRLEIRVAGELDLAVAPELAAALKQATDVDQVVISLDKCEFIDSTGIAVIVDDYRRRLKEDKIVAVAGCTNQVQKIFDVTGLTDNGLVFESVDAALAEWK